MPGTFSFATALGRVHLTWTAEGVCGLRFREGLPEREAKSAPAWVLEAVRRLLSHLSGHRQELRDIPLDLSGLSPFQRRVAAVLRDTQPGQTISYGEVALLTGRPGAARAVGQAVKANPILILVPCHRVVAAHGPGGWSAFGTPERKARLLELEATPPEGQASGRSGEP
jgi:methylated-DNA-[protein]-cysteine S-methyltransferase